MSFDVYVRCAACGESAFDANYTSNMGAFFAWALDGVDTDAPEKRCDSRDAILGKPHEDGLAGLDGLPAAVAGERLAAALARVEAADPASLVRFNAPNGWGTVGRATDFLRRIYDACQENQGMTVKVSM